MASRRKRSKRSGRSCSTGIVRFKTRRGKVVEFKGKSGPSCGPRPKPKTGHLRAFKSAFAKAARACKHASHKRSGKHGKSAFNRCIGAKL
jgi:hypothetical protein